MAWEDIGHGADAVLYWQWRSALNGQEQYHGAIVGPDGEPLPLYSEIQAIGRDFALAAPALKDTTPVSEAAIVDDYDSRWAIDFQLHTKAYDQLQVLLAYLPAAAGCHPFGGRGRGLGAAGPLQGGVRAGPEPDLRRPGAPPAGLCARPAATWCWARAAA